MIDTHCHLLPGLDDGPSAAGDALALARALIADGVERVVATPHYSRRYPTDGVTARESHAGLVALLASTGLRLDVRLGCELTPAKALAEPLDVLRARSIGGRSTLVEAEPDTSAGALAAVVERLRNGGLVPLIAHPERCAAVRRDPRIAGRLRDMGALVQVIAAHLVREPGSLIRTTAWAMMDAGDVDIVASDAHGPRRPPRMTAAAEAVRARYGPAVRDAMFVRVPRRITEGRPTSD